MVKRSYPKFPSELRLDLISGDWVVIATGRARKPETFKREKREKEAVSKAACPFCQMKEPFTLAFSRGKKSSSLRGWTTIVVPNKYPALLPYPELDERKENELFQKMNAIGFHEVVVTKDHRRQMAQFSIEEIKETIDAYQERYLSLMNHKFVNYVSIFHNHGSEAGASIAHPHSQIITTPLIDSDLRKALANAQAYFRKKRKCIYCQMNDWERKSKKRVVFENKDFVVICPFASRAAFQIIISPKNHLSYFERANDEEKRGLAEAFKQALGKLYKGLADPPYNFYLHSAPCDGQNHNYYHWHWTIIPKTATWAGFEIGTRIEISTIEPERAAEYLRKQKP